MPKSSLSMAYQACEWHLCIKQEQSRSRSHKYYQIKDKINSPGTIIAEIRKQYWSTTDEARYQACQDKCNSVGNDSDYAFENDLRLTHIEYRNMRY